MKSTVGLLSFAVVLLLPGLSKAQEGETIGEVMKELQTTKSELLLYKAKADNLEKVLSDQTTKLSAMETKMTASMMNLEQIIKEKIDGTRVAFSVGVNGRVGPYNSETTIIYPKVLTNIGGAYSTITGFFTAPVTGAYFFRFNAMDNRRSTHMGVILYKNHQKILHNYSWNHHEDHEHVSNGVVLELNSGDVVSLRVPQNYALVDFSSNNFNIFSGFLLFPM